MNTIGIISAFEEEIESIKSKLDVISVKNIIGMDFIMAQMHSNSIVMVYCGGGKVNSAVCSQILIDLYAVDYIINVTVASSVSREVKAGDIVVSNKLTYYDFNCSRAGLPAFFDTDAELLDCCKKAAENIGINTIEGCIASGDLFALDSDTKNMIKTDYKACCADMDGTAVAHTCTLNKIPFAVIAFVFDYAESSNTEISEETMTSASSFFSDIVDELVKALRK